MLTHAHFDHIGALGEVLAETRRAALRKREGARRGTCPASAPSSRPRARRITPTATRCRSARSSSASVETPGHTPGGVTLVCGDALFTGDTLFRGSCGRTDFPGGDLNAELRSLERIADLPGDYDVYPGHDMSTRLSVERDNNPYMRHAIEEL